MIRCLCEQTLVLIVDDGLQHKPRKSKQPESVSITSTFRIKSAMRILLMDFNFLMSQLVRWQLSAKPHERIHMVSYGVRVDEAYCVR